MVNRFYRYILLALGFAACFVPFSPAQAQKCDADYEVIVSLRNPESYAYFVWDALYGTEEKSEIFVSGMTGATGNAVVAGQSGIQDGGDVELLLMELDRRGRPIWEKKHAVKGLRKVTKMLPYKSGYMIIGDQQESKSRDKIWIGFFDSKGDLYKERSLRDTSFDLYSDDIIAAPSGSGYVLAASAKRRGGGSSAAQIYRLDANGVALEDRAYVPGLENRIEALTPFGKNGLIGAGYMVTDDGRKAGWILALDFQGKIIWQQQYPRGLAARFHAVESYLGDYVLAYGDANPAGEGNRAAWLMLLDGNSGTIGWQRYYRAKEYHMRGADLMTHKDGQISLLINAENLPGGMEHDYTRLLTLSPRGAVLLSEPYFQGNGSMAVDLFPGQNRERTLVGASKIPYYKKNEETGEEELTSVSDNGWVAAGVPVDAYDDPCVQPVSYLP